MTNLSEQFENAEQLVAFVLKNFPETRENDRTLFLKVWELQGFRLPKKLIPFFYKIHSPETLRRTRQKIQSQGLFLPNALKVAQRTLKGIEHRDYWRNKK